LASCALAMASAEMAEPATRVAINNRYFMGAPQQAVDDGHACSGILQALRRRGYSTRLRHAPSICPRVYLS
jgi:hypothetical protein